MLHSTNRKYLLALLTVTSLFNYVDRTALGLMLQDIKVDLSLSDTQLGFLTGIAFALFYSVMGVPIARWADRGNRVTIIAVTTAIWSIAVAICGAVTNYCSCWRFGWWSRSAKLGCIPPAYSLIADHFSRAERPRAAALYGLGGVFSALVGSFLAGWLNEFYGWRVTFAVLGVPGLVLAILAWRTLRDPRAGRGSNADTPPVVAPPAAAQPSMKEVAQTLWASRTFRHLQLCLAVSYFFSYGIGQWLPSFFIRSYGMSTGELGTWIAIVVTAAGLTGSYLAGEGATRLAPNNEALQLKAVAVGFIAAGALMMPAYLVSNRYVAFLLLGLSSVGMAVANGPVFSTIQTLVPERMRAVAFAILYLGANLVGMGLGPLAVGIMSDAFRTWAGEESLRYSLLALVPGYFWVSWHAWRAAASVTAELKANHSPGLTATISYPEAARVGTGRR